MDHRVEAAVLAAEARTALLSALNRLPSRDRLAIGYRGKVEARRDAEGRAESDEAELLKLFTHSFHPP